MLPSNLLRVRSGRGMIKPLFADPDRDMYIAEVLVRLYGSSIRKKKGEITEKVTQLEAESDYRLVRGLSLLLERRCKFEVVSVIDPKTARKFTFEMASSSKAVTLNDREGIIKEAAAELHIEPGELEGSLFSDLESELVLTSFDELSPGDLLNGYNLSVLQTLLFKALKLEFTASGNWKNIFREIKRQGLMYSVELDAGNDYAGQTTYKVLVEGPLSLFRMTDRYGTSLAKLVPHIVSSAPWTLKADILARSKGRIYGFQLNSEETKGLLRTTTDTGSEHDARLYDSSLEERFAKNFEQMNTGWVLKREPQPLKAGAHVFIPDFSLERAGHRVYLEIMGFWTEEYLNRKVTKLNQVSDRYDIMVAADESLACSKLSRIKGEVIYFKKGVPLGPILAHLKRYDEKILEAETKSFNDQLDLSKPFIKFSELAEQKGVSIEAVRKMLVSTKTDGYEVLGDILISNDLLRRIDERLTGCKKLSEAIDRMEEFGVDEPYPVLARLGYTVRYVSLDPEGPEITKAR